MKNRLLNIRSFTLIELMVVVVIIGIIAGFSIPNYKKALERQYEKTAENDLVLIHSANQVYMARYGGYWPGIPMPWQDVTAINTNLKLSMVENGFIYWCTSANPANFSCYAYRGNPAIYTLTVTQASPDPVCTDGTGSCP